MLWLHLRASSPRAFRAPTPPCPRSPILTIGAILARSQTSSTLSLYFMSLAASLTVLIGVSRIYLGVHYPTDVLAGWCIGGAWALGCWAVSVRFRSVGQLVPHGTARSRLGARTEQEVESLCQQSASFCTARRRATLGCEMRFTRFGRTVTRGSARYMGAGRRRAIDGRSGCRRRRGQSQLHRRRRRRRHDQ